MVNITVIKNTDKWVGNLLCVLLSPFSRKKTIDKSKLKNILIIQLWGIGETILTLPAVSAVRKKYPESTITVLATDRNKEVYFASNLNVEIKTCNFNPFSITLFLLKNIKKYDLVVDFEEYLNISAIMSFFLGRGRIGYSHGYRSMLYTTRVEYNDKQHAAQTFLDSVRVIDANYTSEGLIPLTSNAQDKKKIDSILKKIPTSSKLIGFVPGAAESAKARMLPKDMYIKIANELASDSKYFILFIGSKEEEKLIHEILDKITYKGNVLDLSGKTTLRELFYLISKIDLLVTNDTGPLHIASAQNTKTIGLFGPNTPVRFGPYNKKSVSFYKKSSCTFSPCINVHKGIVPDCLYDIEDKNYQKCMKSITAREIVLAIKRLV